jgi:hypothetical protein
LTTIKRDHVYGLHFENKFVALGFRDKIEKDHV